MKQLEGQVKPAARQCRHAREKAQGAVEVVDSLAQLGTRPEQPGDSFGQRSWPEDIKELVCTPTRGKHPAQNLAQGGTVQLNAVLV